MLMIGLLIGAAVMFAAVRNQHGVAEVEVNGDRAAAGTASSVAVARHLAPAVGTIIGTLTGSTALGSGFVISHDSSVSYLVTNNHVVEGASGLLVVMPNGA